MLVASSGGDATTSDATATAFSQPAPTLSVEELEQFRAGEIAFLRVWVPTSDDPDAPDGLGPVYNATSCAACHGLGGRARPPRTADDPERGLLIRLSLPPELQSFFAPNAPPGAPVPEPTYGGQLQDRSLVGVAPEGRIVISGAEVPGRYGDGSAYTLLQPSYALADLVFGALHADAQLGPRIAPVVYGMGLLEAIPEATLRALADPDDADGDGISGRLNMVWDLETGQLVVGRFGWKAVQPSLEQQVAGAFLGDIGVTSSLFPEQNCGPTQATCWQTQGGGSPEIADAGITAVADYTRTLAVPAARDRDDPEVVRGAELFFAAGCHLCHTPELRTGPHAIAALSEQTIFPYSDLLLHDMGPGLSDGRPVWDAGAREWRTPPLWGIGLVERVNGHTRFLHDGRARSLAEAILWHGGEAEAAKEFFRELPAADRAALIAFLESL